VWGIFVRIWDVVLIGIITRLIFEDALGSTVERFHHYCRFFVEDLVEAQQDSLIAKCPQLINQTISYPTMENKIDCVPFLDKIRRGTGCGENRAGRCHIVRVSCGLFKMI